jgi:hypothetical protein
VHPQRSSRPARARPESKRTRLEQVEHQLQLQLGQRGGLLLLLLLLLPGCKVEREPPFLRKVLQRQRESFHEAPDHRQLGYVEGRHVQWEPPVHIGRGKGRGTPAHEVRNNLQIAALAGNVQGTPPGVRSHLERPREFVCETMDHPQ